MINFFKQLRKDLMNENKTGRYFKYAIGEIILVVIGILIALAISNWNSDRIQKDRNRALLVKLSEEIDQNIERCIDLDSSKNSFGHRSKYTDSLLQILNQGITSDNLDFIVNSPDYYTMSLNLNTIIFEELKNTGSLYQIGSDSLVSAIQKYYMLCQRESFYNYELGKTVLSRREECFKGYYSFKDLYLLNSEEAIADHDWIFDPKSHDYLFYKHYVTRNNGHSKMMVKKLNDIIAEAQLLKQRIAEELSRL